MQGRVITAGNRAVRSDPHIRQVQGSVLCRLRGKIPLQQTRTTSHAVFNPFQMGFSLAGAGIPHGVAPGGPPRPSDPFGRRTRSAAAHAANMSWSLVRTSQAGGAVWLGPCPWTARRWARRRRGGSHRSHVVPLGRVPPPATPWGGPVTEARAEGRRATRWTCHDIRISDDRKTSTTHEHAGPTCHRVVLGTN